MALMDNGVYVNGRRTADPADLRQKISSWAAILFAPTLVASIYGMNFDQMPELHWAFGYPFAVSLMILMGLSLWFVFKRKNWL